MNNTIIENTLKFLARADLKGNEAPAYIECTNYLYSLLEGKEDLKPKKK